LHADRHELAGHKVIECAAWKAYGAGGNQLSPLKRNLCNVVQVIKAFEEAVLGMKVGGIRRIEVPGAVPDLGYSLDRKVRFTDDLISSDLKIFKYRYGPQPLELGGQRALDFVLDNPTLKDFNRNLVFDIKLLAVRRQ
jgi:hypothetical protein